MNRKTLMNLAVLTLRAPQLAAQEIMAMGLRREVLWTGLALVAILNTVLFNLTLMVSGGGTQIPEVFRSPLVFFGILVGLLVLTVHAFFWTGRSIGGQGNLGDLLALVIWLQFLRAVAQAVMIVLLVVSPAFALLLSLATGLLGLWILVNFISASLNLPSLAHGLAVVILAAVGLVLGLLLIGGLIGLSSLGVSANV